MFFVTIILIFFEIQTDAQNQMQSTERAVAFPEVPRVSAYEAYVKYKAGKAIIIQAGGEAYNRRHILGAFNVSQGAVFNGKIRLPNFPKRGIEIFTYCY
jgi:hypothetical protein